MLKSNASLEQKAIACHQLAWIANRDAVPVLAGLLGDEKLSHMAHYALEQIPDPSVEEALRGGAEAERQTARGRAQLRSARRDGKSIPILDERINDADPDVATSAAYAIGKSARWCRQNHRRNNAGRSGSRQAGALRCGAVMREPTFGRRTSRGSGAISITSWPRPTQRFSIG